MWQSSRALLFDKDGTLIDFHLKWLTWCRIVAETVSKECPAIHDLEGKMKVWGVNLQTGEVDPYGLLATGSTQSLLESLAHKIEPACKSRDEASGFIFKAMQVAYRATAKRELVRALPGVSTAIKELPRLGYILAVVTTDDASEAEKDLRILGLDRYFTVIMGCDLVKNCKPAPDLVLETCRRLAVDPSEVCVIGDTAADMKMARNAGAACRIGVAAGVTPREGLIQVADIVLDSMEDFMP